MTSDRKKSRERERERETEGWGAGGVGERERERETERESERECIEKQADKQTTQEQRWAGFLSLQTECVDDPKNGKTVSGKYTAE